MSYQRPHKIELTEAQRRKMDDLWFIYGNYGSKHTRPNHAVIQGFLEHGEDYREAMSRNPPHGRPTQECLDAIDAALRASRVSGSEGLVPPSSADRGEQPSPETRGPEALRGETPNTNEEQ